MFIAAPIRIRTAGGSEISSPKQEAVQHHQAARDHRRPVHEGTGSQEGEGPEEMACPPLLNPEPVGVEGKQDKGREEGLEVEKGAVVGAQGHRSGQGSGAKGRKRSRAPPDQHEKGRHGKQREQDRENAGRGFMRGGPMMGYGPRGGGYCWQ